MEKQQLPLKSLLRKLLSNSGGNKMEEKNMSEYKTPVMEITSFENEDIITTSPGIDLGGDDLDD